MTDTKASAVQRASCARMKRITVALCLSPLSLFFAFLCGIAGRQTEKDKCTCSEIWCCRVATREECPSARCFCEDRQSEDGHTSCSDGEPEWIGYILTGFRISLAVFCLSTFAIVFYYFWRGFAKRRTSAKSKHSEMGTSELRLFSHSDP